MKPAAISRMTYQQYRAARKLVHRCCNYDEGNCLVLECVCVQNISYSLLCRWFRAAVLPQDTGLCDALFLAPSVGKRRCRECQRIFSPPKHNTLYCSACAADRAKRSKRKWARKSRARA